MAAVAEETGAIRLTETRPASAVSKGFTRFQSDDVIFAKITPCMENGKIAVVPNVPGGIAAGSTEFHVIRSRALRPKFIFFYLVRRALREEARRNMSGSAGQLRVPTDYLRALPIPVPPLDTQDQVIKRVTGLFDEIAEGEAALAEARAGVETYRKALLKAAVTGELTADWRRENPQSETGKELLDNILSDRRARWNANPKNKNKIKHRQYGETALPATAGLTVLPDGWSWAPTEMLTTGDRGSIVIGPFGSDLRVSDYRGSGVPLIFVRHIRSKDFSGHKSQFITHQKASQLSAHFAETGDILITKMGDPPGDVAIYPDTQSAVITADCIRWRAHPFLNCEFLEAWINSFWGRAWIASKTKGVAQQKITLELFKDMPVAIPGPSEQSEIVKLLRSGFQFALGTAPLTEIRSAATLRQSILAAAFRGELTDG